MPFWRWCKFCNITILKHSTKFLKLERVGEKCNNLVKGRDGKSKAVTAYLDYREQVERVE